MRNSLLIILFLLFQFSCSQKIENQKELEKTIYEVIELYNKKDFKGLDKFINTDIGLFITYSNHGGNRFSNVKGLIYQNDSIRGVFIDNKVGDFHSEISLFINPNFIMEKEKFKYKIFPMPTDSTFACPYNFKDAIYINKDKAKYLKDAIDIQINLDIDYGFSTLEDWKNTLNKLNNISNNSVRVVYARRPIDTSIKDKNKDIYIWDFSFINNKWYLISIDLENIENFGYFEGCIK